MAKKQKKASPKKQKDQNKEAVCVIDDQQIDKIFEDIPLPDSIKEILEKTEIPPNKKLEIIASQAVSYRSLYPPPEILREYKAIDPALVDTFKENIKLEQAHRHRMDDVDADMRLGELSLKKRGQSIAAWLVPITLILVGVFAYLTSENADQVEVLKIYLWFVFSIGALFVTGRIISGIENIFTNKNS